MTLPGVFAFVGNELVNKGKVTVVTPFKTYTGIIAYSDNEGNIKLMTDTGIVLIQRKYIASVEVIKNE